MGFKEKLELLKAEAVQNALRRQSHAEGVRHTEEEGEKARKAEFERLLEIAREKVSPKFELVNEVYLDGRGSISLKEGEIGTLNPSVAQEIGWDMRKTKPSVELELEWDSYDRSSRSFEDYVGEQLKLILYHDLSVRLFGGSGMSNEPNFSLNDENWEQLIEQGIHSILKTPGATRWHYSRPVRGR